MSYPAGRPEPGVYEIDDNTAEEWLRADVAAAERWIAQLEVSHANQMNEAEDELRLCRQDLKDFLSSPGSSIEGKAR